jgi:pSer/pThr/pTyr-binding forkhead associated (FHA) protein
MIQLTILSGPRQGITVAPVHFPFRIGRGADSGLRLDEPGVWDRHLTLDLRWTDGVWLQSDPAALTTLNGHRVEQVRLRNGDLIEAGSVRLRFSLTPARQRGLRWREAFLWSAMVALCLGQVFLIWRVLP